MSPVEELKPMAYVGQFEDAEEDHSVQFQNSGPILNIENSDSVECDSENSNSTNIGSSVNGSCVSSNVAAIPKQSTPQLENNEEYSHDIDDAAYDFPDDDEEDDDSYDFSDAFSGMSVSRREMLSGPSLTKSKRKGKSAEDNLHNGKICTEMYHNDQYGGKALRGISKTDVANKNQLKDKSDTSTKDNVLDRKTKLHISKMMIRGDIDCVEGCIAAGKEANVYSCTSYCTAFSGVPGKEIICALKVHKTCIATFKNRQEYNEKNPRSKRVTAGDLKGHIVKWCEAEASNLRKMAEAGIPCPKVYSRYEHLLLMELVGLQGIAAPRLHNSIMSSDLACTVYGKIVRHMRTMYWKCNMVHADLSEFNVLLLHDTPYIIDVSQAVPRGHPNSFKHLRQDCTNITDFFRKAGVSTMMIQELFFFIVDMTITDENVESYLDECMEICSQRDPNEMTNEEKVAENVFKDVYLPMTLNEAEYFEQDYEMIKTGLKSSADVPSLTILGLNSQMSGVRDEPQLLTDKREKEANETIDEETNEDIDEETNEAIDEETNENVDEETNENVDEDPEEDTNSTQSKEPNRLVHPDRKKGETAEEKKERKKQVKEQKSDIRKDKKMSKNEKKSLVKRSRKK